MNSTLKEKCIADAKAMGTELFPVDCVEILEKHYKGRLEIMLPKTIIKMVEDLMSVEIDIIDNHEIIKAVEDWLNEPF